ncbi:MAG: membrane-bound lytic murein transglycosylase MltF [Enterovibrio sp.]
MLITLPCKNFSRALLCASLSLVLLSCGWKKVEDERTELEKIREAGVLRVGTLNSTLGYYIGPNGPAGLEYELASQFANYLGVRLEMKPIYTLSGLLPALSRDELNIVAAGMTVTKERLQHYRPGPVYYQVKQQVVYKKGHWRPRNLQELNKDGAKIAVVAGSSHAETLQKIALSQPELVWEARPNTHEDELLRLVSKGELDFTIADSIDIAMLQRTHPNITVAMDVSANEPISWFIKQSQDDSLYALMLSFFGEKKRNGELDALEERYFGHFNDFDFVDTRAFLRAIKDTLPEWRHLFKKHAKDFDWRLLAAISYQESHWNPNAVSPTGVRGLMMLTKPTAESVGVKDRLDPEQSIYGGMQYLQQMINKMPDSIHPEEKAWFALAAYNIGFGHLLDGRALTKSAGANPDSWADVKRHLPLLADPKYFKQMRFGFARGQHAVEYVENIRRYYQSLVGFERNQTQIVQTRTSRNVSDLKKIPAPAPAAPAKTDAPNSKPVAPDTAANSPSAPAYL